MQTIYSSNIQHTIINPESKIAFFDFDGTITSKDSFIEFIRFTHGDIKFFIGFLVLSPMLIAYKLKIIPNYIAKEKVLKYFFGGISRSDFEKLAQKYSLTCIDSIVKKSALERLEWHKSQGHKIVIVSASIDSWLRPWCEKNDIELIATKLKCVNDKITGKLSTKNCHGQEKANRIKEIYSLNEYNYIYAYGDSKGDKGMLSLADKSYCKYFKD